MKVPEYDLFSGTFGEGDAIWLGAVEGLGPACEKMRERAAKLAGRYFVFCQTTHTIRAAIDTSVPETNEGRKTAS
jgi:hypothetical protein